ncbi:hypothetical protein LMG33818_000061 [Halomonadaceae bacterium LMG 33818]|uniref:type II toxin-antitoxin system TacA family antitoxin n=1 Tax=Cernens ardua TaxID=3402176 RepID=UPI003EDC846F
MSMSAQRIEIRTDHETKTLAERASAVSGCSMTQYLNRLIREDASRVLKEASTITLTNQSFDHFKEICSRKKPLSEKLKAAAAKLDSEGY